MVKILPRSFYQSADVVDIAQQLLGKYLITEIDGQKTGGMIIETEAYRAPEDRASHAYNYRRTERNEVMYHEGGISYVYFVYGIHYMFNVVTNAKDVPHAILIRALIPEIGIETMLKRRNKKSVDKTLTSGPGALAQALGIKREHNGLSLDGPPVWIEDRDVIVQSKEIITGPRIGVDYAGPDAELPWRFQLVKTGKPDKSAPPFLYKIVSADMWKKSRKLKNLILSEMDRDFIHLATHDQFSRIAEKFFKDVKEYVVLKLNTHELKGRLVLEANPGGTTKYYHLYEGRIPLAAVCEVQEFTSDN